MGKTETHLELVEEAYHAAPTGFDRRVTMTIAIIAALLACTTLLSHRSHYATLQLRIEANDHYTLAADAWSHYQAKKNRQYLYEAFADQTRITHKDANNSELQSQIAAWQAKADRYKDENKEIEQEARDHEAEAKKHQQASEHQHHISGWYDGGELSVELALVLCSVAVLMKKNSFWYAGIGFGAAGAVVALVGAAQQYLVH